MRNFDNDLRHHKFVVETGHNIQFKIRTISHYTKGTLLDGTNKKKFDFCPKHNQGSNKFRADELSGINKFLKKELKNKHEKHLRRTIKFMEMEGHSGYSIREKSARYQKKKGEKKNDYVSSLAFTS